MNKYIIGKDGTSLGYSNSSCNFLSNKKDRPHGSKRKRVWLSIPDQSNRNAQLLLSKLDGEYRALVDMERIKQKRVADLAFSENGAEEE